MPISLNGNGTITGVAVGGLPDGIVDTDMLAANSVKLAKIGSTSGVNGPILKIETTIKTDAFSHNNNTPTDITGMAVSIQPSASNSKIFITTTLCCGGGDNLYGQFNLLRGSTHIGASTYGTGNQRNATFGYATPSSADGDYKIYSVAYQILDTPSYTLGDTITYKLQCASNTIGSVPLFINRPERTDNGAYIIGGSSTITAMEVAA